MYATIPNSLRKYIYRRDGYQCALCGSTRYLQIHHYLHRGQGGSDNEHNLVTLCSDCHAMAHGLNPLGLKDITQQDIEQLICEYLADEYAPDWNPWRR